MARPIKDGVIYYPKDTDFYHDDKIRLIRSEFGAKGMYIIDYLLCELYGKNGYFLKWDDDICSLVSDDAGCGCDPETIKQIVQGCLRRSFFDKRVFEMFGVLTSAGIQRRYMRMFNSRDEIRILKEYWLLNIDDKKDVPTGVSNKVTFISVCGTENPDKSTENPDKSTENRQIKVNKIKSNKINISAHFAQFWTAYPKKVGKSSAEKAFAKINPDDELIETMINAIDKQSKSEQWTKNNGQFIPYPATWLNGKRWEDDLTVATAKKDTSYNLEQIEAKFNNFSNLGW